MTKVTTIAVDIAKRIFSLYWVEVETGEIGAKTMSRAKFEDFMRRREPSRVVLETGGSAHYWGRWLSAWGHEVGLIAAQHVRPFVRTNKTDGTDARAIWEAAQRPELKCVSVKSEASQAVLGLHRMREQLKRMRRMQSNQLNALLLSRAAQNSPVVAIEFSPHSSRIGCFRGPDQTSFKFFFEPVGIAADVERDGVMQ
jgi:transposase